MIPGAPILPVALGGQRPQWLRVINRPDSKYDRRTCKSGHRTFGVFMTDPGRFDAFAVGPGSKATNAYSRRRSKFDPSSQIVDNVAWDTSHSYLSDPDVRLNGCASAVVGGGSEPMLLADRRPTGEVVVRFCKRGPRFPLLTVV
jgi:hypothetical protein